MVRVDVRPARRPRHRRTAPLLALSLAVGVMTAATLAPSWATAAATTGVATAATEPVGETPTGDPTTTTAPPTVAPPTVEPPAETSAPPPPPETTAPAPEPTVVTTTAAPTTAPPPAATTAPPRPSSPPKFDPPPARPTGGPATAPSRLGVRVTTGDLVLTGRYWNAASTEATLRVTVTNTGAVTEQIRLAYTLPAGVTDAGTPGCASAGGQGWRCGAWTTAPGARFSSLIKVRVSGSAWRQMPLSGAVEVTATAPGQVGSVTDHQGFAVLFPPGPPTPGIKLAAGEVTFDIAGEPSWLDVRLGNTGRVDAAATVQVILPQGVSVPSPPSGCVETAPGRTHCALGTVRAGRTATLRLPVAATPEAQREAPLAGAVVGELDPRSGRTRQVQMSFRITAAAAAVAAPVNVGPAPTGSQGVLDGAAKASTDAGMSTAQRTAVILIAISGTLVVLALALATTSLRRRMADQPADPAGAPAPE